MATDINITPVPGTPIEPITTTSEGTEASKGTEQIVQTPEAKAAEEAQQTAETEVANKQKAVSEATKESLEKKAAAQDFLATEATKQAEERDALIKANEPFIKEAQRKADAAEDAYQNFKFYDFWSKRSTGDKIMARISAALEGAGNGLLGIAGNETLNYINHQIDKDFEQQKIKLHSTEQLAQWRSAGVKDLYDQLQRSLAALDLRQAKAHEAVVAKVQALALRADIPIETAKQNVIVAQQQASAADKKVKATQRYETQERANFQKKAGTQEITGKGGAQQGAIFNARGGTMGTTDKEEARKANAELTAIRQVHDLSQELQGLYAKPMPSPTSAQGISDAATLVRERKQAQEEIRSLLPQVKGLNRLSAPDLDVLSKIVGSTPDAFWASDSSKKLVDNLIRHMEDAAAATVKARGVQPDEFILNPKGKGGETRRKVNIKGGPHKGKQAYDNGNGTYEIIGQ